MWIMVRDLTRTYEICVLPVALAIGVTHIVFVPLTGKVSDVACGASSYGITDF